MLTRMQLSIIVALTMGFALLWLWLRGEQPTIGSVAATLGTVVTVLYGSLLLFALYIWPWPLFRGWLVKRPDLRGSWKATLHSDWIDPKTGQKGPPIEAYMIVRQTLSTLSMRLFTEKARSVLVAHAIEPEPDGLFSLSAVYRNSPKIEFQGAESAIHHGALLMEVHEIRPQRMEGHYWTDRGTRGTIELERKSPLHYSSFEDAKRALGGGNR
jgi:hypothetical protein